MATPSSPTRQYDALLAQTNAAIDQVREVAKWLIASVGGVAGLMLAGVQVTNIHAVSAHLALLAGALVLITVAAAAVAIGFLGAVLLPEITTRAEVLIAASSGDFGRFLSKHDFLLAGYPNSNELYTAQQSALRAANEAGASEEDETVVRRLTDSLNLLVPFGSYFRVRTNYTRAMRILMLTGTVATLAILGYARIVGGS